MRSTSKDPTSNIGFGLRYKPFSVRLPARGSPGTAVAEFNEAMTDQGNEEGWDSRASQHFEQVVVRPNISAVHGLGLFATEMIAKGSFITELIGECITVGEARNRAKQYLKQPPSHIAHIYQTCGLSHDLRAGLGPAGDGYMVELGDDCVIDATVAGTLARFINNSPTPNAEMKLLMDGTEGMHLCIFALDDIAEGEEVTIAG
jgi:hypothetical protein